VRPGRVHRVRHPAALATVALRSPAPSAAGLAVVLVNSETGAWLERCLRSLERARGDVSVDVVVIDNASGDGSADVSEALGAHLIRNDSNRYLSPAWNQGAAVTQTPYLLFLNPDTEWFHGTLAD